MEGTLGGREGVNDTEKVLDNVSQKNGHSDAKRIEIINKRANRG